MGEVAEIRPTGWSKVVNFDRRRVSALLLLAGLVLCLGSALGLTKVLCLTEGCKLYEGCDSLGLYLHFLAALAFGTGLILLLCPMGRLSAYRRFLHICLWAESVLLAWQVIYVYSAQTGHPFGTKAAA